MAVILLRGLVLEGYLISTGSMAPGLLGYHKQVRCPECGYGFAFGISFDDSVDPETLSAADRQVSENYATCPNCGQVNIDVREVPHNHGDQLLVHKHVFDFRQPRRWERVVFRNPADPGEAYVKRVVGLPSETLRILGGDLYVAGRIARKSYDVQTDMRIPVFDLQHLPAAQNWQLPWQMSGGWTFAGGRLNCDESHGSDAAPDSHSDLNSADSRFSWLRFRNWRWFGGNHVVEVPLSPQNANPDWDAFLQRFDRIPVSWAARIEYDPDAEVLRCQGVMPPDMQRDLVLNADNPIFQTAVYRLAALSHVAPVTDRYGYNAMVASPEFPVRDLFLKTQVSWDQPPETIRVDIPVRGQVFELHLDIAAGVAVLLSDSSGTPVRSGRISEPVDSATTGFAGLTLEVSNFDQRVLVVINGKPPFAAFDLPATVEAAIAAEESDSGDESSSVATNRVQVAAAEQNRFALGIAGGVVQVTDMKVFRDVYYTPGRRKHAVDEEYTVPDNCYFVHGDNSPVSSDSRSWPDPCVPHHMLVGKPFVVHLPSRPGQLRIGDRELLIRIPDFHRMRYIR